MTGETDIFCEFRERWARGKFPKVSGTAVERTFPESFGNGGRGGYFPKVSVTAGETDIFCEFRERRTRGYFPKVRSARKGRIFFEVCARRARRIFFAGGSGGGLQIA